MSKYKDYKFRSSGVSNIMSLPRPLSQNQKDTLNDYRLRFKGEGRKLTEKQTLAYHQLEVRLSESTTFKLNDTAKKYLTELVGYVETGRRKDIKSKYFDNGNLVEKQSRDLLSSVLGTLLVEDTERKTNDWVTGQRDIKSENVIIDIKSCYSFDTFQKHLMELDASQYKWQLLSYMDLWGLESSLLAYCLVDTPISLVNDEIGRLNWRKDILDIDGNVRDSEIEGVIELVQQHIYTVDALEAFCNQSSNIHIEWFDTFLEIPKEKRVHLISQDFSEEMLEQRNEMISLAREYMGGVKPLNNITIPQLAI